MKHEKVPASRDGAEPASVQLPAMTEADMVRTLEKMANHYKAQRDDLEQKYLSAQAEAERHAIARVQAETELAALKAK